MSGKFKKLQEEINKLTSTIIVAQKTMCNVTFIKHTFEFAVGVIEFKKVKETKLWKLCEKEEEKGTIIKYKANKV